MENRSGGKGAGRQHVFDGDHPALLLVAGDAHFVRQGTGIRLAAIEGDPAAIGQDEARAPGEGQGRLLLGKGETGLVDGAGRRRCHDHAPIAGATIKPGEKTGHIGLGGHGGEDQPGGEAEDQGRGPVLQSGEDLLRRTKLGTQGHTPTHTDAGPAYRSPTGLH